MNVKDRLKNNIFYNTQLNIDVNPAENHAMTVFHEEVLGQFLDFTGMDPDELRGCLIRGFLTE